MSKSILLSEISTAPEPLEDTLTPTKNVAQLGLRAKLINGPILYIKHKPILSTVSDGVPFLRRFNFGMAIWNNFSEQIEKISRKYYRLSTMILSNSKGI